MKKKILFTLAAVVLLVSGRLYLMVPTSTTTSPIKPWEAEVIKHMDKKNRKIELTDEDGNPTGEFFINELDKDIIVERPNGRKNIFLNGKIAAIINTDNETQIIDETVTWQDAQNNLHIGRIPQVYINKSSNNFQVLRMMDDQLESLIELEDQGQKTHIFKNNQKLATVYFSEDDRIERVEIFDTSQARQQSDGSIHIGDYEGAVVIDQDGNITTSSTPIQEAGLKEHLAKSPGLMKKVLPFY